ncbi:GUN4 domain-containing protein [Iningainema tapete]|uniref:GUN4 domain-containing protein n=1 Tax=Iningainema tapete BLCC-T55 TaxID=2748662 RepID=A0A8J7BXD0_9CYAN|nr:GUN4 domain-containing protein [Iningainema tapete]MBD2773582.1 GUN4 domain-containing protein [Iningainema tapete BLCC-T55]
MLTKQPQQLITYKKIRIYERTYQLPVLKNSKLKTVQKKIRERRRLIKSGVRYYYCFGGIIKWKEEVSQEAIFDELKLLIRDYSLIINLLENYQESYQHFLLKLMDDLKKLFSSKYQEIKSLDEERKKLEVKNYKNPKIIDELKWEKQENFKLVLLLSNASFLMLEKIKLLSEGLKTLAEDTKTQKKIVREVVEGLEVYKEIYAYQIKAEKVRQEIAEIAQTAINFENYLRDYFSPFQALLDEVVKVDEDFYSTVGDIKKLADNILHQSNLLIPEKNEAISETFLNFMVASYEKKERLKDAFIQSKLLDWQVYNLELTDNYVVLDKDIDSISHYLSQQLCEQRKVLGIAEANFVSITPLFSVEKTELMRPTNDDATFKKEFKSNKNIDYSQLRDLLAQHKWKEADIETTKLMLQVIGKNYWNEVYKEDIDNFSCQDIQIIDQLWREYSHGYFGFSVQQSIWTEMGGQVDYETEKKLGDRLGWRKEGNWLEYEQLTFELSPTTPMGHLPIKWLHYDQHTFDLSPSSAEHLSMGAWRVGSWLVWQLHLFLSRVKICNETFLRVNRTFANNREN